MKAYIGMQYHCGECDWVMYRTVLSGPQSLKATIECKNPDCENYEIKYKQPTVELELVKIGRHPITTPKNCHLPL